MSPSRGHRPGKNRRLGSCGRRARDLFHRKVAEDPHEDNKSDGVPIEPRAAGIFAAVHEKQNVVLKARQVGITTYIAARFFVQTITRPGTLSMQVTQDRESAEDIFRIVRRFWEKLAG